jgi:GTP cyclohydrolase I
MARQAPTVTRPLHALEPAADAGPDLHVVSPEAGLDLSRAERAVADLLAALGLDPSSDHLRETPRRVAAGYAELLTPPAFTPTTFPNDEGYDELVLAKAIPFHSLCEHHLLPFVGVAHVGTFRETASSDSPSWRAWSSCSLAACRSRSG